MNTSSDRIERSILLKASRSRVWRALSNAEEFGSWFGFAFKDQTFTMGARIQAQITHPGYEHLILDIVIESMKPEQLLSFRWHPYAVDQSVDYSAEQTTLVAFELSDAPDGTLLRVTESGFDNIPPSRRLEAFRMNSQGWDAQIINIEKHVTNT